MQVITTHINADFDSLASMLAAKKLYPDAKLVFPGSQEGNLRYLLKIPEFRVPYIKLREINLEKIEHTNYPKGAPLKGAPFLHYWSKRCLAIVFDLFRFRENRSR